MAFQCRTYAIGPSWFGSMGLGARQVKAVSVATQKVENYNFN